MLALVQALEVAQEVAIAGLPGTTDAACHVPTHPSIHVS